mgnify:CR=1 FL=1
MLRAACALAANAHLSPRQKFATEQHTIPFDILWSLSPFLLLHHINFGLALACVPLLVYSPFAQRSLILMGAAAHASPAT